jgi:hypothetical protein
VLPLRLVYYSLPTNQNTPLFRKSFSNGISLPEREGPGVSSAGAWSKSKRSGDPAKCAAFAAGEHRDCQDTDCTVIQYTIPNKEGKVESFCQDRALPAFQYPIHNKEGKVACFCRDTALPAFQYPIVRLRSPQVPNKEGNVERKTGASRLNKGAMGNEQ